MKDWISLDKGRAFVVLLVIVALVVGTTLGPESDTYGAGAPSSKTLQSLRVSEPPVMDGIGDDAVWNDAIEVFVTVKGGSANGDVMLKSVYTDTDIYLYAEWEDPTMSITRGQGAWEYRPVDENTLRSARTSTPPVIDGDASDKVWETALPLEINLEFGNNPGDITLRSLHNDTHMFTQAQWNDPTFSMSRNSWEWNDGSGSWDTLEGLEDMVNLMWDMDTVGFDTVGCQVKCHIGKDWSYLDVPGDVSDLWHIMASRSMPATEANQISSPTVVDFEATSGEFQLLGYADDTNVVYDPAEGQFPTGGRTGDEGTAPYALNTNASGESPMYLERAPSDWLDAMVLQQEEVDGGETVVADPSDPGFSASDVADAWAEYVALDAVVPMSIVTPPSDSRADIESGSSWKDGRWTVETVRPLVTGFEDDVQFDDLAKTYYFGVSTMNNTAGKGHNYVTRPLKLDFQNDFMHLEEGSEDRIALLWEITPIEGFAAAGCFVKCHPEHGTAGAFLENEGELGDMWHMKSARSLPSTGSSQADDPNIDENHQATSGTFSFHGFEDDKLLTYDEVPHVGDGGRHGDEGSSSWFANKNPDGTKPLYVERAPEDYVDAMVLTEDEIEAGEALEVATAKATDLADAAFIYDLFGAIIPENVLRDPEGSRGDLEQAAVWSDGIWSTEIRRALVTDNEDDVQFDDFAKSYRFSVALMDNSGGEDHSTPGTDTLLLSLYVPAVAYKIEVGPIEDSSGEPIEDARVVLQRNLGLALEGNTSANGTFSIIVPPEWTDSTIFTNVTKDGFQDLSFAGTIDDVGSFSPMDGTYPPMLKEGESIGEETTPGPAFAITLLAMLGALVVTSLVRRSSR